MRDAALAVWLALPAGVGLHWWLAKRRPAGPATAPRSTQSQEFPQPHSADEQEESESPFSTARPPADDIRCAWQDLIFSCIFCWLLITLTFQAASPFTDGDGGGSTEDKLRHISPLDALLNILFQHGLQIGLVWLYLVQVRRTDPLTLFRLRGQDPARRLVSAFVWIVPTAFVALAVAETVVQGLKSLGFPAQEQEIMQLMRQRTDFGMQVVLALGAVVGAPVAEELIYRGMLFRSLRRVADPLFAALFSSLLFGVTHAHLASLLPLTLLGLGFAWAYQKSGTLLVPIFMHAIFNGSMVLVPKLVTQE